jgi:hypothetical protein
MKPEKQRIAIAEYCGWKNCRTESLAGKNQMLGKCPFDFTDNVGFAVPPDYLNSLDAMHEAEKLLFGPTIQHEVSQSIYCEKLFAMIVRDTENGYVSEFNKVHATAPQRAEAFLRTVGRWDP